MTRVFYLIFLAISIYSRLQRIDDLETKTFPFNRRAKLSEREMSSDDDDDDHDDDDDDDHDDDDEEYIPIILKLPHDEIKVEYETIYTRKDGNLNFYDDMWEESQNEITNAAMESYHVSWDHVAIIENDQRTIKIYSHDLDFICQFTNDKDIISFTFINGYNYFTITDDSEMDIYIFNSNGAEHYDKLYFETTQMNSISHIWDEFFIWQHNDDIFLFNYYNVSLQNLGSADVLAVKILEDIIAIQTTQGYTVLNIFWLINHDERWMDNDELPITIYKDLDHSEPFALTYEYIIVSDDVDPNYYFFYPNENLFDHEPESIFELVIEQNVKSLAFLEYEGLVVLNDDGYLTIHSVEFWCEDDCDICYYGSYDREEEYWDEEEICKVKTGKWTENKKIKTVKTLIVVVIGLVILILLVIVCFCKKRIRKMIQTNDMKAYDKFQEDKLQGGVTQTQETNDLDFTQEKKKPKQFVSQPVEEPVEQEKLNFQTQSSDSQQAAKCIYCLNQNKNQIAIPCGHMICCAQCKSLMTEQTACPICSVQITKMVNILD